MERKIGEIFENNGEWYQCVEGDVCADCAFYEEPCSKNPLYETIGSCRYYRKDATSVIFKKLEKVGEPIVLNGKRVQLFKSLDKENGCCHCCFLDRSRCLISKEKHLPNTFYVEIGKIKEDMEENGNNRTNCEECGDKRFGVIARAKAHLLEATNIASDEKEMAVIDNILFRCYQMGWLERYKEETEKLYLKPFDIQKAREGKPVCTRDGRKARIICFDRISDNDYYKIVACVTAFDGDFEEVLFYGIDGYIVDSQNPKDEDLMMLPEKKEGWVNVYKERVYGTKEEAIKAKYDGATYVDTVNISWEE